jgi:hypothetical protein
MACKAATCTSASSTLLLHIVNVLQQRQSLYLTSIGILLEIMNLCLEIHDPLKTVTSL